MNIPTEGLFMNRIVLLEKVSSLKTKMLGLDRALTRISNRTRTGHDKLVSVELISLLLKNHNPRAV